MTVDVLYLFARMAATRRRAECVRRAEVLDQRAFVASWRDDPERAGEIVIAAANELVGFDVRDVLRACR